jgi:hypothetical protein
MQNYHSSSIQYLNLEAHMLLQSVHGMMLQLHIMKQFPKQLFCLYSIAFQGSGADVPTFYWRLPRTRCKPDPCRSYSRTINLVVRVIAKDVNICEYKVNGARIVTSGTH